MLVALNAGQRSNTEQSVTHRERERERNLADPMGSTATRSHGPIESSATRESWRVVRMWENGSCVIKPILARDRLCLSKPALSEEHMRELIYRLLCYLVLDHAPFMGVAHLRGPYSGGSLYLPAACVERKRFIYRRTIPRPGKGPRFGTVGAPFWK
jgi:hypothetical protein